MSAKVIATVVNPANRAMSYDLWTNGRIDAHGGAIPATGGPNWFELPVPPAVAIHVTSWLTGSGYVLEFGGGFHPFGDAPDVGIGTIPQEMVGITLVDYSIYVDWAWDPDGTGQGYVLDHYGEWREFGGASPCPRTGPRYTVPVVRRGLIQWAPYRRAVMMDYGGALNQDWPARGLPLDGYYDGSRDYARDFRVTQWGNIAGTTNPSGYKMTADGKVYIFGPLPPPRPVGYPFFENANRQATFNVVEEGTEGDPTRLLEVSTLGRQYPWTASTPPRVIAGGQNLNQPPDIVTDTTRPVLAWSYTDQQGDTQRGWRLLVYGQTWVNTHDMTLPLKWSRSAILDREGADPTTRGLPMPIDLTNGAYRFYIRALDSSGEHSLWSNRGWTQNVARPPTPTGLLATVDGYHVNLELTVPSGATGQAQSALFEYTDDGILWLPVRGAEAVPLAVTTLAVDWDVALMTPRTYRGSTYGLSPRVSSEVSPEETVTVRAPTFVLTSTADPTLGGEVWPVGSMSWSREVQAGVFEPIGSDYTSVVSGGPPKSRRRTLTLDSADRAGWDLIAALVESDSTLLLREPFGEALYYRVVGSWSREQIRALSAPDDDTALAHVHEVGIPLVEVRRPAPVPLEVDV